MSIMELCMKELMMQQKLGQEYHFQQQQQQQNFKSSNYSTAIPLPPTPTPSIGPYLIPSSFTVSPIGPFDYAAHQWQQQQQGHNFQPFERKSTFMQQCPPPTMFDPLATAVAANFMQHFSHQQPPQQKQQFEPMTSVNTKKPSSSAMFGAISSPAAMMPLYPTSNFGFGFPFSEFTQSPSCGSLMSAGSCASLDSFPSSGLPSSPDSSSNSSFVHNNGPPYSLVRGCRNELPQKQKQQKIRTIAADFEKSKDSVDGLLESANMVPSVTSSSAPTDFHEFRPISAKATAASSNKRTSTQTNQHQLSKASGHTMVVQQNQHRQIYTNNHKRMIPICHENNTRNANIKRMTKHPQMDGFKNEDNDNSNSSSPISSEIDHQRRKSSFNAVIEEPPKKVVRKMGNTIFVPLQMDCIGAAKNSDQTMKAGTAKDSIITSSLKSTKIGNCPPTPNDNSNCQPQMTCQPSSPSSSMITSSTTTILLNEASANGQAGKLPLQPLEKDNTIVGMEKRKQNVGSPNEEMVSIRPKKHQMTTEWQKKHQQQRTRTSIITSTEEGEVMRRNMTEREMPKHENEKDIGIGIGSQPLLEVICLDRVKCELLELEQKSALQDNFDDNEAFFMPDSPPILEKENNKVMKMKPLSKPKKNKNKAKIIRQNMQPKKKIHTGTTKSTTIRIESEEKPTSVLKMENGGDNGNCLAPPAPIEKQQQIDASEKVMPESKLEIERPKKEGENKEEIQMILTKQKNDEEKEVGCKKDEEVEEDEDDDGQPEEEAEHEGQDECDDGKMVICRWTKCKGRFMDDDQLYDHMNSLHMEQLKKWVLVEQRELEQQRRSGLKRRRSNGNPANGNSAANAKERFRCRWKKCEQFPRRGDAQKKLDWLLKHLVVRHAPKARPFSCLFADCTLRFPKLEALNDHLRSTHDDNNGKINGRKSASEEAKTKVSCFEFRQRVHLPIMRDCIDARTVEWIRSRINDESFSFGDEETKLFNYKEMDGIKGQKAFGGNGTQNERDNSVTMPKLIKSLEIGEEEGTALALASPLINQIKHEQQQWQQPRMPIKETISHLRGIFHSKIKTN